MSNSNQYLATSDDSDDETDHDNVNNPHEIESKPNFTIVIPVNAMHAGKKKSNSMDDMETLKIKSIIRDATYLKFIALKPDGFIYHIASNTMLGRNPSDVVEFLKNPLNEEVLKDLIKKVEKYWSE
jgi:hypothetical protein